MLPDQGDARGEEDQPRGCEDDSEPIPCAAPATRDIDSESAGRLNAPVPSISVSRLGKALVAAWLQLDVLDWFSHGSA